MTRRLSIVSIVGARPQFVKAAVMSRAIRQNHDEILLHTGQHYDPEMSAIFFDEMDIPAPAIHLESGSGSHAEQTATMLVGIERALIERRPDWVVTFGDTNSTLAGGLAAVKLGIPVAHVEAGLRSFNREMPEEINRVLVDQVSSLLFCPSRIAVENLANEGVRDGVHLVGDVMAEAFAVATDAAATQSRVLNRLGLKPGGFVLATIHRAENTDDQGRLRNILDAMDALDEPVVFPVHPRSRKAIEALNYTPRSHVRLTAPAGYLDMVRLTTSARLVLTDSGGLQKEAYWAGVPCVTLRGETEWVETVAAGWNVIVGSDRNRIVHAARTFAPPAAHPDLYGGPGVAARCVEILESHSARMVA